MQILAFLSPFTQHNKRVSWMFRIKEVLSPNDSRVANFALVSVNQNVAWLRFRKTDKLAEPVII